MTDHQGVRWGIGIGVGVLTIVVIVAVVAYAFFGLRVQTQQACKGTNDVKQLIHDLEKDFAPASKIRRPGETDEQYKFRQDQNVQAKALIEKRLVRLEC